MPGYQWIIYFLYIIQDAFEALKRKLVEAPIQWGSAIAQVLGSMNHWPCYRWTAERCMFPGDRSNSPDEWVQFHHYRMQEAVKRANNRIKLKSAERKNQHDKSAVSSELEIGSRVLLRNRVKGWNKIQDTWYPTSYIVVSRIAENNTA